MHTVVITSDHAHKQTWQQLTGHSSLQHSASWQNIMRLYQTLTQHRSPTLVHTRLEPIIVTLSSSHHTAADHSTHPLTEESPAAAGRYC